MGVTVARQKQHLTSCILANLNLGRRRTIRRIHRQGLTDIQAIELSQASAADNRVNSH